MPTHEAKYSFLLGFTSFPYFGWRKGSGNKIWMNKCCPVQIRRAREGFLFVNGYLFYDHECNGRQWNGSKLRIYTLFPNQSFSSSQGTYYKNGITKFPHFPSDATLFFTISFFILGARQAPPIRSNSPKENSITNQYQFLHSLV